MNPAVPSARVTWFSHVIFIFGSSILILAFIILCLGTLSFFLKSPLSFYIFPLSILLTLVYILVSSLKYFPYNALLSYLLITFIFISVLLASIFYSGKIYDISYDGQAYHQEAVIQLHRGWNPIYEQLTPGETNKMDRWLNHYTKGPWIYADSIYQYTGLIETSKAFNFLFIIASFSLVLSALFLYTRLDPILSVLISLVLALNPVTLYQSLSFYIDGQLMSLLVCLSALFFHLFYSKNGGKILPLFAVFVLLLNVKLTAFIYAGLATIIFLTIVWVRERISLFVVVFRTILFASLFAVFVIGFNPFITNIFTQGNPLYPLMGHGAMDYAAVNLPPNYLELTPPTRFLFSVFSPSDNVRIGNYNKLKIPFTVYSYEFGTFKHTDPLQGGFGPLFSGSLVLTFALVYLTIIYLTFNRKKISTPFAVALFASSMILVSVAINPLSSIARFVPYTWVIPVIFIIYSFYTSTPLFRSLGILVLTCLIINIFFIGRTYLKYNLDSTSKINTTLSLLSKDSSSNIVYIEPGDFNSIKVKLDQNHIAWRQVDPEAASHMACRRILPDSIVEFCSLPTTASSFSFMKPTLSE